MSFAEAPKPLPYTITARTYLLVVLGALCLTFGFYRMVHVPRVFDTARMVGYVAGLVLVLRSSFWIGRSLRQRAFLQAHIAHAAARTADGFRLNYRGTEWSLERGQILGLLTSALAPTHTVLLSSHLPEGFCLLPLRVDRSEFSAWSNSKDSASPAPITLPFRSNLHIRAPFATLSSALAVMFEYATHPSADIVFPIALIACCVGGILFYVMVTKPFATRRAAFLALDSQYLEICGESGAIQRASWTDTIETSDDGDLSVLGTSPETSVHTKWASLCPPDIGVALLSAYQREAVNDTRPTPAD